MYLSLIILPLLGSIVSGFFGRKVGVKGAQLITCSCVIITTVLSILCFIEVGLNNIPVTINLFRWIDSEWFNIIWGFQFDSLTVCFVGLCSAQIEAVLVLIQLYKKMLMKKSFSYMIVSVSASPKSPYTLKSLNGFTNQKLKLTCLAFGASLRCLSSSGRKSIVGRLNQKMSYSMLSSDAEGYAALKEGFHPMAESEFLQWFVGFTDAEGNFSINPVLSKDGLTISKVGFMFKIALHEDDEKVLRYISTKLGVGGVRLYKNECIFSVTDKKGILSLISIFDKYNLNTSKYLDYLDFKEAFFYYIDREKNLDIYSKSKVKTKILELKNKMNTSRVDFDRPESSKIIITKYWLLGFIEGDGSFFIRRDNLRPTFSVENTGVQLPVLLKIKEFLESSLGFDKYSLYKIKNSSIISITTVKSRRVNSRSSVFLSINNINVIYNYLIPFFSDVEFLTKKGKDFHAFKIISKAVYEGAYRIEEIRSLILKLSNTMNNFRLSTYKGVVQYLNKEELNKLITAAPTIERLIDGRVRDKITKKILTKQVSCVYEILKNDEEVLLAGSLTEAASIVGLYPETLSKYLDVELLNLDFIEIKNFKIRRVGVFCNVRHPERSRNLVLFDNTFISIWTLNNNYLL